MTKKLLIQIGILFLLGIPLLFDFKHYNLDELKKHIKEEYNFFYVSNLFFGSEINNDVSEVSATKINVKKVAFFDDILEVEFLDGKVYFPFNGYVYQVGANSLAVYDYNGIAYRFDNIDPGLNLYQYFSPNTVIGVSQSNVTIHSSNANQLLSYYHESYEEA